MRLQKPRTKWKWCWADRSWKERDEHMKRIPALIFLGLLMLGTGTQAAAGLMTMETPHFNIHFPAGKEQTAVQVAEIAEDVHAVLTERMGYIPAERTEIHLLDTSDLANGFADPTYFNKIGIYLAYPNGWMEWTTGLTVKAENWLRLVLTHEYAHILHLDMHQGVTSLLRRVFGRVPFFAHPNHTMSTAFIEGIAVHEETANTAGGRGTDPYYEMFLRTAVLEEAVPTFDQMLGLYDLDNWQPAGNAYLYGWSLVDYIARKYGEEKLAAINRDYSGWNSFGLFPVLARNLGIPADVLWKEWRRDLEEKHRRRAGEIKAAGLVPMEELTGPVMAANPAFNPEGTMLAYVALGKKDFFPGLYLLDRTSGGESLLVAGQISSRPAWSPCGRRLVYAKPEYVDERRIYNDLYLYDLDKKEETKLTRAARAGDPVWAPAGDRLVYVARDNQETSLVEYDLTTGQSGILRTGKDETQFSTPVFSPDGKLLAVGVWLYGGYQGIAVMNCDGGNFRLLLCDRTNNRNPVFTSDGKYLLFDSDRDGVHNIYAYEISGGSLWKLTGALSGAFAPAPSPDGEELIYMSYTAAGYLLARTGWADLLWEKTSYTIETPLSPPADERGIYPVKPYNCLPSLAPKYWLPYIDDEGGEGLCLGIQTGGMDAVGRHVYDFFVSYGFAGAGPNLMLNYQYNPLGRVFLRLHLAALSEEVLLRDRYILDAKLGLSYPGLLAGREFFSGLRVEQWAPYGEPAETGRMVYGGWTGQKITGKARVSFWQQKGFITGLCSTDAKNGYVGEGFWQGLYVLNGTPRAGLRFSTGLAQFPGYFALGGCSEANILTGTPEAYQLRGFEPRAVEGAGFLLVNAEAYPFRFPVERAFRDLPFFLRQVRGGFFLDTAYVGEDWEFTDSGLYVSTGAEIRLTTDLFYQTTGLDLRLGVAKPLHPADDFCYYIAVGSEF